MLGWHQLKLVGGTLIGAVPLGEPVARTLAATAAGVVATICLVDALTALHPRPRGRGRELQLFG